jgi:hypothetical protein
MYSQRVVGSGIGRPSARNPSRTIELFRQHTEKQEEEKAERQKAPPRNKEREEHATNERIRQAQKKVEMAKRELMAVGIWGYRRA